MHSVTVSATPVSSKRVISSTRPLIIVSRNETTCFESELTDRRTIAWALILICSTIIGLNIPLKTMIFFHPLLMALTHLVRCFSDTHAVHSTDPSRCVVGSSESESAVSPSVSLIRRSTDFVCDRVSLFGLINMKAVYFPFALIGIDLVSKGPQAALQAFTGLVSAHIYWFLTSVSHRPLPLLFSYV